jgi:hypothetical protein
MWPPWNSSICEPGDAHVHPLARLQRHGLIPPAVQDQRWHADLAPPVGGVVSDRGLPLPQVRVAGLRGGAAQQPRPCQRPQQPHRPGHGDFPRPAAEVLTSTSVPTRAGQDSVSSRAMCPLMEIPRTFAAPRQGHPSARRCPRPSTRSCRGVGLIGTASPGIVERHHLAGPREPENDRGQQRDVRT